MIAIGFSDLLPDIVPVRVSEVRTAPFTIDSGSEKLMSNTHYAEADYSISDPRYILDRLIERLFGKQHYSKLDIETVMEVGMEGAFSFSFFHKGVVIDFVISLTEDNFTRLRIRTIPTKNIRRLIKKN